MGKAICPDCKGEFEDVEGPVHEYMGGSAGCWHAYGKILEKEYSDPRFMAFHRFAVDSYAAQHPGKPDPRAAQSVQIHLMALFLLLERNADQDFVARALGRVVEKRRHQFNWFEPPSSLGEITVARVLLAEDPEDHGRKVREWARSVWNAWTPYHAEIQALADDSY